MIHPTPKEVLEKWIAYFNKADVDGLVSLYHEDAVNHQVTFDPVVGKKNIHAVLRQEFAAAEMVCISENIFCDGDWAILEWKDPLGLRGCGFFNIVDGKIKLQRGYWDRYSFEKLHNAKLR